MPEALLALAKALIYVQLCQVPNSRFYFRESSQSLGHVHRSSNRTCFLPQLLLRKLDGLGLVDWSLWMPRVLVGHLFRRVGLIASSLGREATNYVNGAHNCVAPNPHFSICCIDECGSCEADHEPDPHTSCTECSAAVLHSPGLLRQMEAGAEARGLQLPAHAVLFWCFRLFSVCWEAPTSSPEKLLDIAKQLTL